MNSDRERAGELDRSSTTSSTASTNSSTASSTTSMLTSPHPRPSSSQQHRAFAVGSAIVVVVSLVGLGQYSADAPPPVSLALFLLASTTAACVSLRRALVHERAVTILLVVIALRVPLSFFPPLLSDDVYRYIHEGRAGRVDVTLPYRTAPIDAPSFVDDDVRSRVNHPHVRAAYFPQAQFFFILVTTVGDAWSKPLFTMKFALVCVDILLMVFLFRRRRSIGISPLLRIGTHPLPLVAGGFGPHYDVIGVLLVVIALTLRRDRPAIFAFLVGWASGLKPFALAVALMVRKCRSAPLVVAGFFLPMLLHLARGAPLFTGAGTYAEKWRASPFLFGVIEWLFSSMDDARRRENVFAHLHVQWSPFTVVVEEQGAVLFELGSVNGGVPVGDDVVRMLLDGSALARGVCAVVFLVVSGAIVVMMRQGKIKSHTAAFVALLTFFALTPTVHPWYFWWVLPFAVVMQTRTIEALAGCAVFFYGARLSFLTTGQWDDPVWPQVLTVVVTGWVFVRERAASASTKTAPPLPDR